MKIDYNLIFCKNLLFKNCTNLKFNLFYNNASTNARSQPSLFFQTFNHDDLNIRISKNSENIIIMIIITTTTKNENEKQNLHSW